MGPLSPVKFGFNILWGADKLWNFLLKVFMLAWFKPHQLHYNTLIILFMELILRSFVSFLCLKASVMSSNVTPGVRAGWWHKAESFNVTFSLLFLHFLSSAFCFSLCYSGHIIHLIKAFVLWFKMILWHQNPMIPQMLQKRARQEVLFITWCQQRWSKRLTI